MKKLIKKNILISLICVLLLSISLSASALEEHMDPDYFLNISFEIPDDWEYSAEVTSDNGACYLYTCDKNTLYVYTMHYEDEYDENQAYIGDAFVGLHADSYSDADNYAQIEKETYEINGLRAQDIEFLCNVNGLLSTCKDTSINTGYEVVEFIYVQYLGGEDSGLESYEQMIDEIQVGASDLSSNE